MIRKKNRRINENRIFSRTTELSCGFLAYTCLFFRNVYAKSGKRKLPQELFKNFFNLRKGVFYETYNTDVAEKGHTGPAKRQKTIGGLEKNH